MEKNSFYVLLKRIDSISSLSGEQNKLEKSFCIVKVKRKEWIQYNAIFIFGWLFRAWMEQEEKKQQQ